MIYCRLLICAPMYNILHGGAMRNTRPRVSIIAHHCSCPRLTTRVLTLLVSSGWRHAINRSLKWKKKHKKHKKKKKTAAAPTPAPSPAPAPCPPKKSKKSCPPPPCPKKSKKTPCPPPPAPPRPLSRRPARPRPAPRSAKLSEAFQS